MEESMLAVACRGKGGVAIESRPVVHPGAGELLLALEFCGLCGTDLFKLAADTVPPGTVLGHEIVGRIVEVGEGARSDVEPEPFRVGDRVVAPHHVACGECAYCRGGSETVCRVFRENLLDPGGFSELVLVRERAVRLAARRVPEHVPSSAAVFLEPAACVERGVERSGLREGGVALVIGGGSMGLLHLLVLRARRAEQRVVVVDPLEDRRRLALELGASAACAPDGADDAVRDATEGRGADAVFDTVGGERTLVAALAASREGGTVVLFAHARAGETARIDLNRVFKSELRIVSTYSGALGEQSRVHEWIVSGALDASPLATATLPFSRFEEAVERARGLRDLKILLRPDRASPRLERSSRREP